MLAMLVAFAAGFIDSIAGGGGLITLPYLTLVLETPVLAVGTNKILGTVGALTAFIVYQQKHKADLKTGALFCSTISLGSIIGSKITMFLPAVFFNWILLILSPIILFIVLNKEIMMKERFHHKTSAWYIFASAILCGVYDGAFGPGGGTFMLLALLLIAKLPLFLALTLSKLANTVSAGTALASFAYQGAIDYKLGLTMALTMTAGAFLGSKLASTHAMKIVRPALVIVVSILLFTIIKRTIS
jgi:uncharacterized protein